jgi:hypothetical protein
MLGLALAAAPPATAQIGVDLTWASAYRWRGLSRHEGAVLQGAVFASVGTSSTAATRFSVTTGAWANLALARPDPARSWGASPGISETNPWIELAFASRPVDLALGTVAYLGRDRYVGRPVGVAGTEWYLRLESLALPILVPRFFYAKIFGAYEHYFEPALFLRIPLWTRVTIPVGSLTVGATMGVVRQAAGAPSRYTGNGITHWELSGTLPIGWLPVSLPGMGLDMSLVADYRVTRGVDPATTTRPDGTIDKVRHRFALTLTVMGPRCRPERNVCDPPR